MKKIPSIILLSVFSIFLILYLFFPKIIFPPKQIVGCLDRTASNYNKTANVNDSTLCKFILQPTVELGEMVDSLVSNPWDELKYYNLRSAIKSYYKSIDREGSMAEDNALENLDNNYIKVLYDETKKVSKNCYKNYSDISQEVYNFYKKYKGNSNIKSARRILSNRKTAQSYKSKIKKMLTKEYDTKNYNDLEQDINNFMNSSGYKSYIKKCSKLSLQTSYNNLIEFSQIPIEYSMFLKSKDNNYKYWKKQKQVPNSYRNKFKNYDWYHNEVEKINKDLKNTKNKWFK